MHLKRWTRIESSSFCREWSFFIYPQPQLAGRWYVVAMLVYSCHTAAVLHSIISPRKPLGQLDILETLSPEAYAQIIWHHTPLRKEQQLCHNQNSVSVMLYWTVMMAGCNVRHTQCCTCMTLWDKICVSRAWHQSSALRFTAYTYRVSKGTSICSAYNLALCFIDVHSTSYDRAHQLLCFHSVSPSTVHYILLIT